MSTTTSPTQFNDVLVSPVGQAQGISFVEYGFVLPITITRGVSSFWFEIATDGVVTRQDNGGEGYSVQDGLIFVPQMGTASAPGGGSAPVTFDVVLGVRSPNAPTSATMTVFDSTFVGSPSTPFSTMLPLSAATNTVLAPAFALYKLYGATFTTTVGLPTVDIAVEVDGVSYSLDFVRPRAAGDAFPEQTPSPVSTTELSPGALPIRTV